MTSDKFKKKIKEFKKKLELVQEVLDGIEVDLVYLKKEVEKLEGGIKNNG